MTNARKVLSVLFAGLFFLPCSVVAQAQEGSSSLSKSPNARPALKSLPLSRGLLSPPTGSPSRPGGQIQSPGSALKSVPLRTVKEGKLEVLLNALEHNNRIVAKDNSAIHLAYDTPIIVIPLSNLQDPEKTLYMYYLPETELYFFLQLSYNGDRREEARLWTTGSAEILLSEDAMVLLPNQSEATFRIPEAVEQMAATRSKIGPSAISPSDILACIARIIGISIDPTSLANKIASASCSALNVVNLVVLACDCLSIPSAG